MSEDDIDDRRTSLRFLYGRIIASVVLYALFIIFSTSAVLTGSLQQRPFLLGGLLVGAVLFLPRSVRRPGNVDDDEEADGDVRRLAGIRKWLTWARLGYLLVAVFLWFGLPELV